MQLVVIHEGSQHRRRQRDRGPHPHRLRRAAGRLDTKDLLGWQANHSHSPPAYRIGGAIEELLGFVRYGERFLRVTRSASSL
jgi:hypothetical protein